MTARIVREWKATPESEPETIVALTKEDFAKALDLRPKDDLGEAIEEFIEHGYLVPDVDRADRWLPRLRGTGRDRVLIFRGVTDPLRLRQLRRGWAFDRRHGTGPEVAWSDTLRR